MLGVRWGGEVMPVHPPKTIRNLLNAKPGASVGGHLTQITGKTPHAITHNSNRVGHPRMTNGGPFLPSTSCWGEYPQGCVT